MLGFVKKHALSLTLTLALLIESKRVNHTMSLLTSFTLSLSLSPRLTVKRIDGSVSVDERQSSVDSFNAGHGEVSVLRCPSWLEVCSVQLCASTSSGLRAINQALPA